MMLCCGSEALADGAQNHHKVLAVDRAGSNADLDILTHGDHVIIRAVHTVFICAVCICAANQPERSGSGRALIVRIASRICDRRCHINGIGICIVAAPAGIVTIVVAVGRICIRVAARGVDLLAPLSTGKTVKFSHIPFVSHHPLTKRPAAQNSVQRVENTFIAIFKKSACQNGIFALCRLRRSLVHPAHSLLSLLRVLAKQREGAVSHV